jgi:adenylate cyclase
VTETNLERKLRAILSADVKGYSLLMADDEIATIQTITSYREIMKSLIEQHKGRVVDSPGDNLLAEFQSVVDAVQCAVEIQNELKAKNDELPSKRRMDFRIGINLGDIVQEGERIYGDGVNIAARIESKADPGGISISGTAFDSVRNKLGYGYEYTGEQKVKNIANPVKLYKVIMDPAAAGKVIGEKRFLGWISRKVAIAAILTLAITAGGLISYNIYLYQSGRIEPASIDKMAFPLPDIPSIAVLPFTNLSGDPNQEYFSDGITEYIITSLSKVPYLLVIARNSTFAYKHKAVKVQNIAEELSVQYILEGSVQRSNDRVRITAQLIDATAGHHLWANTYDRNIGDIFSLQDEIAVKIMAELQLELTVEELGKFSATKTKNIRAYEKYLMGSEYLLRRTEEDSRQAKKLAEEAISLDPEYSAAYQLMAKVYFDDYWYYKTDSPKITLDKAEQMIQKSIEISGQDATNHSLLGILYFLRRQYDEAITECQKAIDLSPNSAETNYRYAQALRYAGRFEEAILHFKKAIRLNPITPMPYMNNLAWVYAFSEQYEKAIPIWNKVIERNPDYFFAYLGLAMSYQLTGNELKAREAAAEVMRLKPKLTVSRLAKGPATKNYDREHGLEALRKAGIPE